MATTTSPFLELFAALEPKREGRSYKMRCPFHADDTPSLSVDPEKGLWQCFGCGEGGDAITFLQRSRGLEFGPAADLWRQMSGQEPKHTKTTREGKPMGGDTNGGTARKVRATAANEAEPNEIAIKAEPSSGQLLERMAELYTKSLAKSEEALAYLQERGITDMATIRAFRLGYVDGSRAKMAATSAQREALTELGILNAKGTETLYGCIVAPLFDRDGQVTSFLGRRIQPSDNPHRVPAGPKSGFFHVQAAKGAAHGELVLVEGFLDALACYQAGIRNVMAIGGATHVNPAMIDLLAAERVKEVLLAFDPDDAGDQGSKAWAEQLERQGIGSRRVRLDVDPNEFFRTGGTVEAFRARAESGESLGKPSNESELLFQAGGVLYRAKACGGPGSKSGKLRVHLLASFAPKVNGATTAAPVSHRDTLDLYSHKARKIFSNCFFEKLTSEFEDTAPSQSCLDSGLETLVEKLERRSDQRAQAKDSRTQCPAMSPQEREAAESFLREPNLVGRLQDDMNTLGYVGETEAKLLVYLIATSRKLPRPLSGIIGSGSGAGKSFLAELAELLMPPEDVELFSKLTPQALYYLPEDYLFRKLLVLEERAGGEGADYAIRTLQSKDKLTQLVTIKDPVSGVSGTKQFTVRGPVAYLETTTDSYLNPENTSRCFEIPLDESAEQTRRIHEHQRLARSSQGLAHVIGREALQRRHHNAQRLLESVRVVIPYAQELTFPDRFLRTRRDHERFLSLIEAVAFLHQMQRPRKEAVIKGETVSYIEATPEDYEHAHALALKVLWVSLDELSRWGRELVDWMRAETEQLVSHGVVEGSVEWTRRQVRERLNWPDRRLREAIDELVSLEHLEQRRGTPGNVFYYRLGQQTKAAKGRHLGLLDPEELRARLSNSLK
jgi:5S rRNA maturation endonuclease (ribonuclease M5)